MLQISANFVKLLQNYTKLIYQIRPKFWDAGVQGRAASRTSSARASPCVCFYELGACFWKTLKALFSAVSKAMLATKDSFFQDF